MDDARLAASKAAFHRRMADLPFEEKIRAVVRMQQTSLELSQAGWRPPPRHVWDISDLDQPPIGARRRRLTSERTAGLK